MKFYFLVCLGLSGCTTIKNYFICEEGNKALPTYEMQIEKWENTPNEFPNNLGSDGSIPELRSMDKYRDCSAYQPVIKRYSSIRKRWEGIYQKLQNRKELSKTATREKEWHSDNPNCVDIATQPYSIVQKIDDSHYEISKQVDVGIYDYLILETKQAIYTSVGHPTGIGIEAADYSMKVRLENGFDKNVRVVRECAIIPYKSSVRWPGAAFRQEINGH